MTSTTRGPGIFVYFVLGGLFGTVLIKSQVVSWFRIQEMFRFESFHMYGIILTAVATAAGSVRILKALGVRTFGDEEIVVPAKQLGRGYRYWIGGTLFGMGWALTGACPGPLVALTAGGPSVYIVAVASALVGTRLYAQLRGSLPHY